jgi:hypothetical protein
MTALNFGYPQTRTTHNSYLLRDPYDPTFKGYDLVSPYVWNHFCFSFKKGGFSIIVLVGSKKVDEIYILLQRTLFQNGDLLNINFIDNNLRDVQIPLELLQKVYLLRCSNGFDPACTTPGGTITDFNIWDSAMTADDMKEWTTCKYVIFCIMCYLLCLTKWRWLTSLLNQKGI